MKKRYESLTVREVPAELDRRILGAARTVAHRNRMRRIFRTWILSGGAAAAALLAGVVIFQQPVKPVEHSGGGSRQELLAMCDWSNVEQTGYNLSFQLDSGNLSIAELAEARIPEGF